MNPPSESIALVLDANQRSALAVTRSLGSHGVRVITADCTPAALAGASRHSGAYLRCPSPAREPGAFIEWLLCTIAQHRIGFLQPVTEISSQLILRHRGSLPATCILPFPALETVLALADKGRLMRIAADAGVRIPATRFVDEPQGFDPASVTGFPVVLKPRLSRVFLGDRWLDTAVAIAPDRDRLRTLLRGRPEFREHPFMVQEFVPGSGAGVFALYDHGKELAFFAHRRLREKPPAGGVSVLSVAAPADALVLDAARRLLAHAGWHGVAMVEFRVTPDGTPYLMEVNTRFWGSLQLAIDAGVDFPWLLYCLSTGHVVTPPASYRVGRRLRWWLGDLDSLYLVLRDPRVPFGAKAARVAAFLTPHPLTTRHEVFRWWDPMPGWFELKAWARALRS